MNENAISQECYDGEHSECDWERCACICHERDTQADGVPGPLQPEEIAV